MLCVRQCPDLFSSQIKRALTGLGFLAALCLGLSLPALPSHAQSTQTSRVRIPISATGQAAIGRVRGRLQIGYDERGIGWGSPIYLRLIRDQKRLEVWVKGRRENYTRLRSYKICGANAPLGPRTTLRRPEQPEGFYAITRASLRPQSVTYLGLDMGWPNALDRASGWRGSASLLQAGCSGQPHFGLTDQDMEEVYTLVHGALARGQSDVPLHIFPFDMNALNMLTKSRGQNAVFWRSLEPAWSAFERTKKPPQVLVSGRRYIVSER